MTLSYLMSPSWTLISPKVASTLYKRSKESAPVKAVASFGEVVGQEGRYDRSSRVSVHRARALFLSLTPSPSLAGFCRAAVAALLVSSSALADQERHSGRLT